MWLHRCLACVLLATACSAPAVPTEKPAVRAPVAQAAQPTLPAAAAITNGLSRVSDSSTTCMLSNRFFGERKQVPVQVAGKTYHGCCPRCAARLGSDAASRSAIDPFSGNAVDKASAVLAHDERNALYYFESEATLARWSKH